MPRDTLRRSASLRRGAPDWGPDSHTAGYWRQNRRTASVHSTTPSAAARKKLYIGLSTGVVGGASGDTGVIAKSIVVTPPPTAILRSGAIVSTSRCIEWLLHSTSQRKCS